MTGDPTPCWNCGAPLGHPTGICPVTATNMPSWTGAQIWVQPGNPFPLSDRTHVEQNATADMTHDELVEMLTGYLKDEVFARRFADCITMIRRKNADYTQGVQKKDRIAAFRRIGGDIDVPMAKVWAIFAQKHWGAVMKFVKDGQVESEPIDGRINDLINYFVLLGAIIHDKEEKK